VSAENTYEQAKSLNLRTGEVSADKLVAESETSAAEDPMDKTRLLCQHLNKMLIDTKTENQILHDIQKQKCRN
jgi:hypothetical protein